MKLPAPKPCDSCPYRRDVPSGVWHAEEYAKLPLYDEPTGDQPFGLFQCHQYEPGDEEARVCAGWVGCHGPDLIALRIAVIVRSSLPASVFDYTTTVPLFGSGREAAEHGLRDIEHPSAEAVSLGRKIMGTREDIDL